MLPNSPGIKEGRSDVDGRGFLEACRPRLANLVEVGLAGGLGDADTVAHLLAVNDAVQQVLADEAASENRPPPPPPAQEEETPRTRRRRRLRRPQPAALVDHGAARGRAGAGGGGLLTRTCRRPLHEPAV